MNYHVVFAKTAIKSFKKLDKSVLFYIKNWIEKNLEGCENPRIHGKALKGNLANLWRYRIGDYRLICDIRDNDCVILAVAIGHRRDVYKA